MIIVPSSRPRVTGRAEFEKVVPRMKSLAMNLPPRRTIVEVNLVGERRMSDLNRKYRSGRGAAEILTFSYVSDTNDPAGDERVAGDLIDTGMEEEPTGDIDKIRDAIMKLPDGFRIVLSLYLIEGYDHEEIAQILGISSSTSRSQYTRARLKLVELLKGHE